MAILYISEYYTQTTSGNLSQIPSAPEPALVEQAVAIPGTSAKFSDTQGKRTFLVRVVSDIDCWLTFGNSPTGQTNYHWLPARVIEYKGVNPGDQIAVDSI